MRLVIRPVRVVVYLAAFILLVHISRKLAAGIRKHRTRWHCVGRVAVKVYTTFGSGQQHRTVQEVNLNTGERRLLVIDAVGGNLSSYYCPYNRGSTASALPPGPSSAST
jgi:hypothetical protein